MKKRSVWDFITLVCVVAVLATLVIVIGHVMDKGLRNVNYAFLTEPSRAAGVEGGIKDVIAATMLLTGLSLALAIPISIAAAIYLQEFAKPGRLLSILTSGIEVLAGIPSVVFGLFGFGFFVTFLGWSWCLLSGAVTLALMALPILTRTSMEAIRAVPASYRDASLALGASQLQTITKVVLPAALPGIVSGAILSLGRVIGETAAVILTFGSTLGVVGSLWDSGRTLPVHLFILANENISVPRAYATGAVLLIIIMGLNACAYIYQGWALRNR